MSRKTWFESLFGFNESTCSLISRKFAVETDEDCFVTLTSNENGQSFRSGRFSTPSLESLREQGRDILAQRQPCELTLDNIATNDVRELHAEKANRTSVFQAASQFNCLEFPGSGTTPEEGITAYSSDYTQGPSCSVACAPGTLFRNYFAPVRGQIGQSRHNQINNMEDVEVALGNTDNKYFRVRNGYTSSDDERLEAFVQEWSTRGEELTCAFDKLKIGVHEDTQVVYKNAKFARVSSQEQVVTQCFCSAISCGYSHGALDKWEMIAANVLKASYKATLWATVLNAERHGWTTASRTVFLTMVGGGVFGNLPAWINQAIASACHELRQSGLIVHVVHFRNINHAIKHDINARFAALAEA